MAANPSRLASTAFHVHLALSMDQTIGTIPGRAILRTFANEPEQALTVAVGGLSNQFLFGEYVHPPTGDGDVVPDIWYLARARRLRRHIEHTALGLIPFTSTNERCFPLRVWMQAEHEWNRISFMRDGLFHFDHGGLR